MKLWSRILSPEVLWTLICALLLVLSYPPTYLWPLSIVSFAVFSFFLFEEKREKNKKYGFWHYFRIFFLFTFAVRLGSLYWIPHTFIEFSQFPLAVAWAIAFLVYALMALPGALVAGLLIPRCHKITRTWPRILAIFAFWFAWDFCDYRFFPWVPAQSFGAQKHLLASAGVLGTNGWNLIFYALLALLHWRWTPDLRRRLLTWSGAWVVVLLAGGILGFFQMKSLREKYSARRKVALLQGAVGNFEKKMQNRGESPTNENVLRIYRDLVESLALKQRYEELGELFVFWPETAFPGFPLNDSSLSELLSSWAKITKGYHLIGAYEEAPGEVNGRTKMLQYNVVAGYASNGEFQGHYRKVVRMPFGEYIPGDKFYPGIYDQFRFLNNFGKGERHIPLPHPNGDAPVFLPFICFEILDESFVREAVRSARAQYPGRDVVLVNPTNDSWFGEGAELFLHSHLAIWQAAREGVPFVRPTNTGISMVVAPWGEILARGRVGIETTVMTELPLTK